LAERKLSVTEIALDVGFSETSSFTAAFRKCTGETPTATTAAFAFGFREYCETGEPADRKPRGLEFIINLKTGRRLIRADSPGGISNSSGLGFQYGENSTQPF
jgi:AraC-like DNA-binding protein